MADKKITELTEETVAANNEPLAIASDPSGTPITKKIQTINLLRKSATFIINSSTSSSTSTSTLHLLRRPEIQVVLDELQIDFRK